MTPSAGLIHRPGSVAAKASSSTDNRLTDLSVNSNSFLLNNEGSYRLHPQFHASLKTMSLIGH